MGDEGVPPGFEVLGVLGRGSFGEVLRVRDPAGREFALKRFRVEGASLRERRELEAARGIDHPRVIRTHGGEVGEGAGWILLELAEGTLADILRDPGRRVESWERLREAAEGLAALHRAGLVHRDVKPENILLTPGGAKVGDLGLIGGADLKTLTATGMIMGTPVYMAPEQARGEKAGPAADAWALGAMFFELLEGRPPHPELAAGELLVRLARGERDSFTRARSLVPPAVLARIEALLAPDPGDRPADLARWAAALGPLPDAPPARGGGATEVLGTSGAGAPSGTRPLPMPSSAGRTTGGVGLPVGEVTRPLGKVAAAVETDAPRRRGAAAAAGALVLGLAALGAWWGRSPAPPGGAEVAGIGEPAAAPEGARFLPEAELPAVFRRIEDLQFLCARVGAPEDLVECDADNTWNVEDGVPGEWPATMKALGVPGRFLGWIAEGGDPRTLGGAERERLARLGERISSKGLVDPFAPYLELEPASGDDPVPVPAIVESQLRYTRNLLPVPEHARGWVATAQRELAGFLDEVGKWELGFAEWWRAQAPGDPRVAARSAEEVGVQFVREFPARYRGGDPGVDSLLQVAVQNDFRAILGKSKVLENGPEDALGSFAEAREVQVALARAFGEVQRRLRRFLWAAGQALRSGTRPAAEVAKLVAAFHRYLRIYWFGVVPQLPLETWTGPIPEGLHAQFFLARIVQEIRRHVEAGVIDAPDLAAREVAACRAILRAEPDPLAPGSYRAAAVARVLGTDFPAAVREDGPGGAGPTWDRIAAMATLPEAPVALALRSGSEDLLETCYRILAAALLSARVAEAFGPDLLALAVERLADERTRDPDRINEVDLGDPAWEVEGVLARARARFGG